ncbi:MAG: endonuclease/exonuclease/phosphatase family protein [Promethearchaeota archaeon]
MSSSNKLWTFGFLSIFFIFFLQLTTGLIEAIYTVNLLGSSLNFYAAGIVLLLGGGLLFVIPLRIRLVQKFSHKPESFIYRIGAYLYGPTFEKPFIYRKTSQICAVLVIIARLISPILKSRPTILVAGFGVTFFLVFYPLFLLQLNPKSNIEHGYIHGLSFGLAILVSILFRTLGATRDLSYLGWYQLIGWIFAGFCVFVIFWRFNTLIGSKPTQEGTTPQNSPEPKSQEAQPPANTKKTGSGPTKKDKRRVFFASFSLLNIFMAVIFGFESPAVFVRWTEGNYAAINIILTVMIAGIIIVALFKPGYINKLPSWALWTWNLAFTCLMVLTILVHTIQFPPFPGSPVVVVQAPMWYQQIPLYLMLLTSPILILDFMLVVSQLIQSSPKLAQLSAGFGLSGFLFIILIFIAIFTNVWGYVKPISNLFRNLYWLPYLIIGLFMTLGVLAIKHKNHPFTGISLSLSKTTRYSLKGITSLLLIGVILGTLIVMPHPVYDGTETTPITSITVMTYNIQQGNNDTGEKNYENQLEVILNSGADIIALQECDTARIGLGNNDIVQYLATKLNYYSYYGPKTIYGTYGTAILSRFPITYSESIFSYSHKDETGTAYATIEINGEDFHVFSSHPDGNASNHLDHMNAIIDKITSESLTNVISMGDFNTRPYSEYYNISVAVLDDAWNREYPTGIDAFGNNMTRRIDYIFISPEFILDGAWVIPEGPSQTDHNVFWSTISW